MQIYEIKRPDSISFSFKHENSSWFLFASDREKEILFTHFCIDLCKIAKTREKGDDRTTFNDLELSVLIQYFDLKHFIIDRRDTVLENKLKEVIKIVGGEKKETLLKSIDFLSYNQQYELANKLAEVL